VGLVVGEHGRSIMSDLQHEIVASPEERTPSRTGGQSGRLFRVMACLQRRRAYWLSGSCVLGAACVVALVVEDQSRLERPSGVEAPAALATSAAGLLSSGSFARPAAGPATLNSALGWRGEFERGEFSAVAERLLRGDAEVSDEPAALMDAADALRFADQPEAAVGYLRRVLSEHATSPVAPLASFTLGRVLLQRMGQPAEAADAFALARSLQPGSSLAQDALASEVEAWSKAGRDLDAFERARLYVQLYPAGRRLRAVRRLGGLE
jgi:hypothetical protein